MSKCVGLDFAALLDNFREFEYKTVKHLNGG